MSTTAKSKSSAKGVDESYVRQARQLAGGYRVSLWTEEGHWYGRCVELPNCMGDGGTPDLCVASVRDAIVAGLASDLADGLSAPPRAGDGARTEQVNLRLSADEIAAIEANASRYGFRGMADYMRTVALVGFRQSQTPISQPKTARRRTGLQK